MDEKVRILIVDDDESTCRTLALIFGKRGYETEVAGTGREAMEKAKERFFNVALLDIKLPDIEGIELLRPLKEMHPDMALIMVTAHASVESAVRSLSEGASSYITKPLNMDEVMAAVREALEKQDLLFEKRRAEEALRESEEKYCSLVESTEDFIYLVDRNCRYLFINEKRLSRFGLPPDKVIGRTYGEFHSEEETKEFEEKVREVFETGKSLWYESRSQRHSRYFLRTLSPVKEPDGGTTAVTVVSKEITEHKRAEDALRKSEERFRRVIENIFKFVPEGLLTFTDKLNLFRTNKAFQDIVQKYSAKLNYTEQELTEIIIEQVKNRIINEDYADIRIPKNRDEEAKNR